MMIPEEIIEPPFVDADEGIMNPIVSGKLANGGLVTKDASLLTIDYNCKRKGTSTV